MLSRCTGQVDVGVHITVFGMAEINKAGEGHHEARAERFALECDPAQFLGGEIAPGLWIVAPVFPVGIGKLREQYVAAADMPLDGLQSFRSEEHTSELQSLMRISYAVFCLKKKKII